MKLHILLIIFLFSYNLVFGQTQYSLQHFSLSDGISDSYITGITEDTTGKIWISTYFGVNAFTGSSFEHYVAEDAQYNKLMRNDINCIYTDISKKIWIGGQNGTIQTYNSIYDRFDNVSLNLITIEEYPSFYSFYQKNGTELYGLSSKGLYRFSKYSGKFHKAFREVHELYSTHVTCMNISKDGSMLLGTRKKGLIIVSSDTSQVVKIPIESPTSEYVRINCLLSISDSVYYVGTSYGLLQLVIPKNGSPSVQKICNEIGDEFISSLTYDGIGNVWIGTGYKGVWILSKNLQLQQMPLLKDLNSTTSGVTVIFKDSQNRMWIGTPGNGLFLYNPLTSYIHHIDETKGLHNTIVSAIIVDEQENIWVGTDGGGINIYSKNMQLLHHLSKSTGLPSDAVLSFVQNSTHIWISTWRGGIASIDKKTFAIRYFNEDNSDLLFNGVKSIAWYAPDTLVVGTHGEGLQLFNTRTCSWIQDFKIQYSSYFPDEQKFITQVAVDNNKKIWVATIRNLYCIYNKTVKDVLESDNFRYPQNPMYITSISVDKAGYIIAATNKGVYRINTANYTIEKILTTFPEFVETVNLSVCVVNSEQYWIANTKGLFVYNPKTKELQKRMLAAHASQRFFVPRAMYVDPKGYLYIGTCQGMYAFALRDIVNKQTQMKLEFAHLYINHVKAIPGGSILEQSLLHTKQLLIPYTTQNKSITFRIISFEFPETIEFAYKFEGFDKEWQYLGFNKEIHCNNLLPGTYTLRVKARQTVSNSSAEISMSVVILPPWWKTWWFIGICLCIAIVGLWLLYKLRMYRIQRERKLLQIEVNSQLKAIQQQKECIEEQRNELQFVSDKLEESNSMLLMQNQELEELAKQLQEESLEISQLNESLKQSNITKEQLFAMITHDIYNSFDSLGILANKLQSYIAADSHKKPIIQTISQTISSHKELLKNLIIWAKNQTNSIDVNLESIRIDSIMQELVTSIDSVAQEKNCTISIKNKDTETVYADSQLVLIALRTLVYSIIQNTASGSFILISAETKKEQVEIQVHVQEIDEQLLMNALQFKKQIKKQNNYSLDSQNLHIVVSQQCIEKCNGTFTIHYSKERGLHYSIALPAHNIPVTIESTQEHNVTQRLKIAVLDDNQAIVKLFEDYLKHTYLVFSSTSPKEFIDTLDIVMPDIVISDIGMPDIDGYSICKIIKQKYNIPVILISSNREDTIKQYAYACGANAYIDKPVSKDMLFAVIKNMESQIFAHGNKNDTVIQDIDDEAVFLKKFEQILVQNLANTSFSVENIAMQMNLSRTQLFRKIKQIHAMSPKEYLNKMRMQTAGELLKAGDAKIVEVAYAVGFSDPSYFTKCFIKFYGVSPSEYKG
jgi:ligand-binding sensor domain-containing protein/AraC-like DNA-binding protein/signal transduction histidine kinase